MLVCIYSHANAVYNMPTFLPKVSHMRLNNFGGHVKNSFDLRMAIITNYCSSCCLQYLQRNLAYDCFFYFQREFVKVS